MEQNPELADRMAKALAQVEAEFPDPPNALDPLHVPAHVAARWQAAICREAERRALDHGSTPTDDLDPVEPHDDISGEKRNPQVDPGTG